MLPNDNKRNMETVELRGQQSTVALVTAQQNRDQFCLFVYFTRLCELMETCRVENKERIHSEL